MCVAAVIYGDSPKRDELAAMEDQNPHGAGIAWPTPEGMVYYKGLTAFEVYEVLRNIPRPALVHFRYATHGPKEARLTHPFPLGDRAILDPSLTGIAPAVLIHNGVWGNYWMHRPAWAMKLVGDMSDTQIAAFMAETDESILDDVEWATAVARAPFDGQAKLTLRGRWYRHDDNHYSNLSWKHGKSRGTKVYSLPSAKTKEQQAAEDTTYYTHGYRYNHD